MKWVWCRTRGLNYVCQSVECRYVIQWRKSLLEELTVAQHVQKFTVFYGTRSFITVFWRTFQWELWGFHGGVTFKSSSFGLWRCVVLWQDTNVSEVHAASIFRGIWNVGIIPQHYMASQSRRPRLGTLPESLTWTRRIKSIHYNSSSLRSIIIYLHIYAWFLQVVSSFLVFRLKFCMHFSCPMRATYPAILSVIWHEIYVTGTVNRKPEGKRSLGRPRRRWKDHIRLDRREIG
jgi:hypothetical protein